MYNKYIKMDAVIKLQNEIIKDKEELLKLIKKKIEEQQEEQAEELETIPEINNLIEITSNDDDFVSNTELKTLINNNNINIKLKHLKIYLTQLNPNIRKRRNCNYRGLSGFKIL